MTVSRILFDDMSIRPHLTISALEAIVVEDIKVRYGANMREVHMHQDIRLDAGGMAYISADEDQMVRFEIEGTKFSCQDLHVSGMRAILNAGMYRTVESEVGKLVRIYLPYEVLVLPLKMLTPLVALLDFETDKGDEARKKVEKVLEDANAAANANVSEDLNIN